jgi:hypothetical protein
MGTYVRRCHLRKNMTRGKLEKVEERRKLKGKLKLKGSNEFKSSE